VLGSLDSFGTDTFSVRGAGADAPRFEVLPPLYPQLAEAFRPEERTEPDGRRVWTVRGGGPGSAVATESRMPGRTELLTTVRASEKTAAQLAADVLARVRELSDPATQTNAAAIARAIVPAEASVADKVRAVRDWSFLSLRRAGPAWQSLPLRFLTPADVTVADRYGHALDCRIAELCLLRALGLDADLLLFDSDWDPAPDPRLLATATSHTFDSVALRVRGTDGAPDLYLDGATQYARLGACAFAGRHCVDAARPDEIFVCGPALGADELLSDADRTFVTLEISEDGSALVMRSDDHLGESFDGYNRSYSRMLAEERRRSTLESAAAVAQDAELAAPLETDLDPAGPGRRTLVLRIPDFAQRVGDNLVFQIPLNLPSLSPELAPRRFPFVREGGYRATSSVRIVPPKDWRLAGIPKVSPVLGLHRDGIEPEAAGARWESVLRPPRAIAATQDWTWLHRVELDPAVIPPEAFPAYRREALRTRGAAVGTVVLERIPE